MHKFKVKIPEGKGEIGFSIFMDSIINSPGLLTVAQFCNKICRTSVRFMKEEIESPTHIVIT